MAVNECQVLEHVLNVSMAPVDTFDLRDGSYNLLVGAGGHRSADQYLCCQHQMLLQEKLGKGKQGTQWQR